MLGWSSNSLYKHFDSDIINKILLQFPFLVLYFLEYASKLDNKPYVDEFLWAGGLGNMPEVNLSLDVYMQHLTFDLAYLEFQPSSYYYYYYYTLSA